MMVRITSMEFPACSLAANSRAPSACSPAWAASDPPCSAMPSCTRATSSPPRQRPQPTRPPALGACGSAPGSAQRARAGQACWGQDRPSRNRSARQRVRSTHLRGPRHGCSTQVITLAGLGRYDARSRTPPALRSSATRRDRTLGPCWVRSAPGPQRRERSLPVTKEEQLVDEPSAQAARTTRGSGSDCGPEGQARCVGQQTGSNRPP
jgi:hypothetical protein